MEPEEIAARIYDGFSRGDLSAIQDVLSADVVVHMPGRNRLAGDYRGIGPVLAFVARAASFFDPSSVSVTSIEVHEGLISCRVEVGAGFLASSRGTVRLTQRMRLGTDGRIVETWIDPDELAAWDALFGTPTERDGD